MTAPAEAGWAQLFERQRAVLPGGGPVERARADAMAAFRERGLPTGKEEAWRYTRLGALAREAFAPLEARGKPGRGIDLPGTVTLSFGDGTLEGPWPATVPGGVVVERLADVLRDDPERAAAALASGAEPGAGAFSSLNAALVADGAVLRVTAGRVLTTPIHLRFASSGGRGSFPRVHVHLEPGASATVVESYGGIGPSFGDAVTEVDLGEGASLTHVKLQALPVEAHHVGAIHVRQGPRSRLCSISLALGGALARTELTTVLGDGAEAELHGLVAGAGEQLLDHHTLIDHAAPNGRSRQLYKAILDGKSRGVFDGRIVVRPGAQKTDARQHSKNLLLSSEAEVDTKPQLEIFADDVKCAHGATSGQIDEDALFYLCSRGMDAGSARRVLTVAFAAEVLAQIGDAAIHRAAVGLLTARMPEAAALLEGVA